MLTVATTARPSILPLLPNLLSAARVPLALAFPFARGSRGALAIMGVAGVTDMLDGWAARQLGGGTARGALIDGLADKVFAAGVLGTLLARRTLSPALVILLTAREIIEVPLAIRVLARGGRRRAALRPRSANRLGKLATALEFAAAVVTIARGRVSRPLVFAAGAAGVLAGVSYWTRELGPA